MKARGIICRGRARAIEDALEPWRSDHADAMEVRDVEDVIQEYLWLFDLLQGWYEEVWRLAFAGKLRNIQMGGRMLQDGFEQALELIPDVRGSVEWAKHKGYQVDGAAEFEEVAGKIQRLSEDLARRWPFVDDAQVAESRQQIARGEYQTGEEILRDLQDGNPA